MKNIFSLLLILTSPCSAFAGKGGGMASGGGAAVVCRGTAGQIQTSELLDLYEGQLRNMPTAQPSGSLLRDYFRAVKKTYALQGSPGMFVEAEVMQNLRRFFEVMHFTDRGTRLPRLNDLGKVDTFQFPEGCGLEQLAIFNDHHETVAVDSEIWNSLDSLNQAALISHETFYRQDRRLGISTSASTRATVALIYSQNSGIPVDDGLPATAVNCSGSTRVSANEYRLSNFWVYRSGQSTILQLYQIMGLAILSRATVDLGDLPWENKFLYGSKYPTGRTLIAATPGVDVRRRRPVLGLPFSNLEIEVEYSTNRQIVLSLFRDGILVGKSFTDACEQDL